LFRISWGDKNNQNRHICKSILFHQNIKRLFRILLGIVYYMRFLYQLSIERLRSQFFLK
jgi:hypothetical protein